MSWTVLWHPDAETERHQLPTKEEAAIVNAADKLQALGPDLPFPHTSNVQIATDLRELRPRAGRSAWRAFYRRIGAAFVIAAVGPEAQADPRGFRKTVQAAERRLDDMTE